MPSSEPGLLLERRRGSKRIAQTRLRYQVSTYPAPDTRDLMLSFHHRIAHFLGLDRAPIRPLPQDEHQARLELVSHHRLFRPALTL